MQVAKPTKTTPTSRYGIEKSGSNRHGCRYSDRQRRADCLGKRPQGRQRSRPITHFDASLFKTQFACEVKDYDPSKLFDRKKSRSLDLYAMYALSAADEAIADSGIEGKEDLDRNRVGVIFAAGIGGLHTFEQEAGEYAKAPEKGPRYNPFFIPKMIADIAAGQISIDHGFRGPNFATVSACASSNNAFIDAFNYVRLGFANAIVTGGAEAAIYPAGVGGFNSMRALSTRNDDPKGASRPFSGSRERVRYRRGCRRARARRA